jgi:hypothetical protein
MFVFENLKQIKIVSTGESGFVLGCVSCSVSLQNNVGYGVFVRACVRVYKLKCQIYPGSYMGQTGWNFKTRYKEHIQDVRNTRSKTGFLHHILNTGHAYDSIENTLTILNTQGKRPYLKYYLTIKQSTQ